MFTETTVGDGTHRSTASTALTGRLGATLSVPVGASVLDRDEIVRVVTRAVSEV
jgi:hypothetical protein